MAFASTNRLSDHSGSTGFVPPWARIEFVDDNEISVAPEQPGLVRVFTNVLAKAFSDEQSCHQPRLKNGYFYRGDVGRITDEGELIFGGRVSDIINIGGVKNSLGYIEDQA